MSQTFGKVFAKKEEGKVRPISAAFAALACAVGASNIVGVPVAIALGGPGAVFWIWVLAILGYVHQVLRGRAGHQVPP